MLPGLSVEQRHMMEQFGMPLPLFDHETQQAFLLLRVAIDADAGDAFRATVQGFDAVGLGENVEEATIALSLVLRACDGCQEGTRSF